MAITRHNLSARERFIVSNYVVEHLEELRALSSNEARAQHVGYALDLTITIPNLEHAAKAADVSLSPPPKPKPAPGGPVAALIRTLIERIEALEAALVRANDVSKTQAHDIRCLQDAVRTALPAFDVTYRTTLL